MPKKESLQERVSTRVAKSRRAMERSRLFRVLGGRGAATLVVGAALSLGGLSDAMSHVHFLVQKDLDAVRVIRQTETKQKVVAKWNGTFTGNAIFKVAQLLPDRYVSRQLALFDDSWVADDHLARPTSKTAYRNVFVEEMTRINDAIRKEFFNASMPFGDIIHEKAEKYDVDPLLVAAVIEQESKFRHNAKSQVGARGLMQLMPKTGRWMGARDLYDPEQNVDAGVRYIKYLQSRFDGNLNKTIAAYNAGEGNVRRYNGIPPFRETQQYVKKVLHNYAKRNKQLQGFEKEQGQGGGLVSEPDGSLTIR